jgi:hypothetical protein
MFASTPWIRRQLSKMHHRTAAARASRHQSARSTVGPALGRETSRRSTEKPGEVTRAFLLVNSAIPPCWRTRRCMGPTSWPVNRICSVSSSRSNRDASGGPLLRDGFRQRGARIAVGHQGARVSRHVGTRGVADQSQWARSFITIGAPPGPLAPVRFEASLPTRRDTYFHPPSCGKPTPLACHYRAIEGGQSRPRADTPDRP